MGQLRMLHEARDGTETGKLTMRSRRPLTRGILEAIYWKPAIRWVIDRIHVLNEIRFENIRRNEVGSKIAEGDGPTCNEWGSNCPMAGCHDRSTTTRYVDVAGRGVRDRSAFRD